MSNNFFEGNASEFRPFIMGTEHDEYINIHKKKIAIDGTINSLTTVKYKIARTEVPSHVLISTPTYMMGYNLKLKRTKDFIMTKPSVDIWNGIIKHDNDFCLWAHKENQIDLLSTAIVSGLMRKADPLFSATNVEYSYTYPLPVFSPLSLSYYSDPSFTQKLKEAMLNFKSHQEAQSLKPPETLEIGIRTNTLACINRQELLRNQRLLEDTIANSIDTFGSIFGYEPKVMLRFGPALHRIRGSSEINLLESIRYLGTSLSKKLLFASIPQYYLLFNVYGAFSTIAFSNSMMWWVPAAGSPIEDRKLFFNPYYDLEFEKLSSYRSPTIFQNTPQFGTAYNVPPVCRCPGCRSLRQPKIACSENELKRDCITHYTESMEALVAEVEDAISNREPLDQAIRDRYGRSRVHANIANVI